MVFGKHLGGLMFRNGTKEELVRTYGYIQSKSKIPFLMAANLEAGGSGIVDERTTFGKHTQFGAGNNIPWFVEIKPILFISFANPYHLLDVPMVKTFINCYTNHDMMIETVVEKITGKSICPTEKVGRTVFSGAVHIYRIRYIRYIHIRKLWHGDSHFAYHHAFL